MGNLVYSIDKKNRIINTKCTGNLTLEELKAHATTVVQDQKFQKGMNSISDFRDADLEHSFLALSAFREYLRPYEQKRDKFKWALIVNTQKGPSAISLFQTLLQDGIFTMKLFTNRNDAESWILNKSDI
jgi:hypothetical protein